MSEFTSCNDCLRQFDNGDCRVFCKYNKSAGDMFIPKKPKKKIIDLSVCVESGIDMEFAGERESWFVGKLGGIASRGDGKVSYYNKIFGQRWGKCRVRESSWHYWQGGECPLPEGLKVKARFFADFNYKERTLITGEKNLWNNTFAFKVIGVADGWKYEWMRGE